jgi:hypothetical protein
MAKSKEISSRSASFAKGGKTKMFGKQHAGPQKSGTTGKANSGDGGKFARGGTTHMFGKQCANPRRPGVTGK